MKTTNWIVPFLILCTQFATAQQVAPTFEPQQYWRYSPELSEEELYNYSRLMYMPREDWDAFRLDPRYDDQRVRDMYREQKGRLPQAPVSSSKMLPPGDCDCWIEPDATYTQTDPNDWDNCGGGGPGVDCWIGPINLPFDFCFYGQTMNQIYLTSKGTIAFGSGYIDWTPSEFPTPTNPNEPQYDHIAGFWADFDFRQAGEMYYKVTDEAFYLNYVGVGYYANHSDKLNTFQIIIAADDNGVLPNGTNVQLCYLDMDWAHGDVGGGGGFGGPTPGNVGADRVSGNSHIQFGRFNLSNANYNGPYGQGNNQQDGIDWLDNKVFEFSACSASSNIPPIPTISAPCDTIYLCLGDEYSLNMQFLSPETGQITSIQATQSGTGMNVGSTSGNTANVTGTFTASADNVGVNEVTITASDNGSPAQTTTLTFIFLVQDVVPPPISISGELSICAGGETLLTATEGFDAYEWSTGCADISCLVENGGNVTVQGFVGTCASTATVFIDASSYFIPDLVSGNDPIVLCPGTTAFACLVDEWASYSWSVYPGYPGELIPGAATDEQCLEVTGNTSGNYQVIVEDENGCQGFNIQNVEIIESFIDEANDNNSGAYCNGFEPVTFTGGFSNPAEGNLTVYLLSSSSNGWQGSNLIVTVTHTDGTTDEYIMSSGGTFTIANAPISVDDQICIEYVSVGFGDENNQVWIFNCSNQGQTIIGPGLTPGEIWCGTSGCTSQPLFGTWTVDGPDGWTMTSMTEYNSVFTPTQYGMYNLCFNDPACGIDHCYELEFTLPPSLTMSPDFDVLLCGNETNTVEIEVDDIGGTGVITWTGQGVVPSANGLSATAGPYSTYVTTAMTATITNGCGTASASVNVEYQPNVPEPTLTDDFICNGGSTVLDPIPNAQDNPNLEYDWSNGTSNSTLTVTQTGSYSVTVSNECDASNMASADITLVPPANLNPVPPAEVVECDDDQVTLNVGVPDGYSIEWSNGSSSESITVSASGNYCYEVTDNLGCNTMVDGCSEVIISDVPSVASGSGSVRPLCPGECEVFDLAASNASSFEWDTDCSGYNPSASGGVLELCGEQLPIDCLGDVIEVTGTATNVCGSASATWFVQADACAIIIPNVFTPNGDEQNAFFFIAGLEKYPNTRLLIFDRWGGKLFESDDYQNDWGPRDISAGTYYYILELPFGTRTQIEGHFTVLK